MLILSLLLLYLQHLGVEDFRLHRFLMAHFLHSAMQCRQQPAGTIAVSLVHGQAQRCVCVYVCVCVCVCVCVLRD